MRKKDELIKIFSMRIRSILEKIEIDFEELQEIRLRVGEPLLIQYQGKEYFITDSGRITTKKEAVFWVDKQDIQDTISYISSYSLYAFEDEIRQGFITIQGGHRVGIAGKIVMEGKKVKSMKYISYINVRLSHQIKGCANNLIPYILSENHVCHCLIISPPRCGKTTLLRDLIRQISDGIQGLPVHTVGVVDERSEIAGCYQGIAQNDLGIRTDVLDCCPKAEGMMMLIRSMSPGVIAVDEIGDYEDVHAIESVIHCGCKLLATVHGSSMEDIKRKPLFQKLVDEKIFERYIILQNKERIGALKEVLDESGNILYQEGGLA